MEKFEAHSKVQHHGLSGNFAHDFKTESGSSENGFLRRAKTKGGAAVHRVKKWHMDDLSKTQLPAVEVRVVNFQPALIAIAEDSPCQISWLDATDKFLFAERTDVFPEGILEGLDGEPKISS